MESAKCKKCGSTDSLLRFRWPDEDEPPVADWTMECVTCGEKVAGTFSEGTSEVEAVAARVAEKFWI